LQSKWLGLGLKVLLVSKALHKLQFLLGRLLLPQ
jgi:hypothetical protein